MMTKFHFPAKEANEGMEKTDIQKVEKEKYFRNLTWSNVLCYRVYSAIL